MPEEQGVYRIVNGKRYAFPNEEKAREYDNARQSLMQKYAEEEGVLSQAGIFAKSILPGLIRGTGLTATGIGSVFDSDMARKAGEYLEEKAKQTSEAFMEPYQRYTTGAMLGETAGGIIPGMAATAATVAAIPETGGASLALLPAVVGGLVGAAQGAGEVGSDIREARARGAQVSPEQERNLALIQGGITGVLEGGIAGKVAKGIKGIATARRLAAQAPETEAVQELLKSGYGGALRRGLGLAVGEGATEGAQQLSQNILARGDISALGPGYDPQRELLAGVPESVLVGGLFGGVLGGGIELYKQKTLQKRQAQMREAQTESAPVEQGLESGVATREVEGQQQQEILRGILAEQEQARLDEEAKNEAKKLDTALTSAVNLFENEKATFDQKLRAYKEIAAQELFSKTFADLTGNEQEQANRKASELSRDNVDPKSRALFIQMKERAEQEAALPSGVEGPMQEPSAFIPSKEIEIKRLADEVQKAGDLPEGSRVTLPTPPDEVTLPAALKVEPTASGDERIPLFQEKYSSQIYQMPYDELTEDQQNVVDKIVERQTHYSVVQPKIQAKQQAAELKKQREGIVGLVDLVARQRQREQTLQEEEFNKELALEAKQREEQKAVEDQQKAEEKQRLLRSSFDAAVSLSSQEGIKIPEKRKLFKDIIAIVDKGSLFEDLKGKDRTEVNAQVTNLISSKGDISGLPSVKKFRAAQALSTPSVAEEPAPSVAPEIAPALSERQAATEPVIEDPFYDPSFFLGFPEPDIVPRPKNWNFMSQSEQLSWANTTYPYARERDIEKFVKNTQPGRLTDTNSYLPPENPDEAIWAENDYSFRRRLRNFPPITEEGMSKLPERYRRLFTEEGMSKLPKGQRPVALVESAAMQPERGTLVERMPKRQEVPLNLDVDAARAVSQKAYQQLKDLNVSDIYSTVVVDRFLDEKGNPKPDAARFLNNVIKLASKDGDTTITEDNIIKTINHEVVHGMKESGFFTDAEWKLLTNKFTPISEMDDETVAAYTKRYTDQGDSPEVVQEKLQEEAVAAAIERLSDMPAKSLDIPSVSLLSKVKSLARLGTAANNLGYTAEDLISAVRAGQVGRRAIKGAPTVLDAIREGRTPRQLMPQVRPQVGEAQEELPEMVVESVDESEIPVELRGEVPERISKEGPEITEESKELPGAEGSSPMYKIPTQKPAELFVEKKDDSLVNMVQRGVSSGSPTFQILNDLKNYLFETRVAKAAFGPESELGKVVSARQSILDQYTSVAKSAENLRQFLGPNADKYTAANSAAIVAIRQSQKSNELLSTMLLEGYAFFDPKTGFILVKKSKDHALMPQLENLAKKGKINQAFDAAFARGFMETQRATGNAEAILGGLFSVKDYQAIEAKYAKDTDIQEFLRVYRNLNDALLELNRYVGNFDQATTQRYKRYFYTPRYRVPVDKDGYPLAPTASNAKIANLQGLKPIKGAKLPVADAMENIISNAQFMLSYAMKNEAGVRTVRDAVDANIAKATGTAKAIKVREPKFAGDPSRVVRVNVKGKPEYYEILDPLLYQAMVSSGFTPSAMDMVGRSFGRIFRSGITRSFPFAFGNMFLDSINLWSLGIYKGSPIVAVPTNLIKGGVSVFNSAFWKTDPALKELASAGLLPSDIAARNSIDAAKNIKKKLKIEQDESLKYLFSKVWDGSIGVMEKLANASETVNRVQVYKNVLKDMQNSGMPVDEAKATALYATMQYPVNFDTRGSGQIASWVASYLPFVSASAQGTDVFYRHIRDIVRTGKTRNLPFGRVIGGKQMSSPLQKSMIEASKTALYQSIGFGAVYSLLMAAFGWEQWKKLRLDERYRTLLVPVPVVGGGMVKIPVPQTLGAISLMIPAALAESIMGHDNGAEIAKSMAAFFAGMFTFDPTPQFIRPVLEVSTNKNFFTWRPIENESLQKLPPQYRYDERTNLLSRYMSKFLNEVAIPISPVQFEHLVRGYLGTLGVFANELISQTVDIGSQNQPQRFRPFTDPHLLPGIGKIFLDPDVDRKAIDDYYAIRNAATQAANALKTDAAFDEFQSNPETLREMLFLSRINEAMDAGPEKEMQELRKLKKQVLSAPGDHISPSKKTEIVKQINLRMNEVARSVQPIKRYIPFTLF